MRNKLRSPIGRKESLRIKTFGECETELTVSCESVNIGVGDISGRFRTQIEAFVVPVICAPLGNQEIDRAQVEFQHLSDLNLADNNEGDGVVEIDLLIDLKSTGNLKTARCHGTDMTLANNDATHLFCRPHIACEQAGMLSIVSDAFDCLRKKNLLRRRRVSDVLCIICVRISDSSLANSRVLAFSFKRR